MLPMFMLIYNLMLFLNHTLLHLNLTAIQRVSSTVREYMHLIEVKLALPVVPGQWALLKGLCSALQTVLL